MNTLRRIAILFFGVIFTVSLFMLVRILVQGRQEQAAFDRLSAALEQPESADGQNPEQSHYEALKAQNPDFESAKPGLFRVDFHSESRRENDIVFHIFP